LLSLTIIPTWQLLNISLPYDSSSISVNQATIWPRTSKPPHVYANQVLLDISPADLQNIIASGQLDISHETGHGGGGFFGVSYHHSLHHVHGYPALVFRFDVVDIYSNQPDPPFTQDLNDSDQEIVEMVLLQKPLMSALEPVSFEIIKAELVPRSKNLVRQSAEVMHFRDWDAFGQKGIMSHLYTSLCSSSLDSLANSTFGIFFFVLGVVILFLIVCIVCLFGCNPCADEYEQAQHGKSSGKKKRRHHSGDVETGGLRFKSAEELGLLGKGRVVGIGKSD
jgi:hypothetical protein